MNCNEFVTYRNDTFKEKIPTYYEMMPNGLNISMNNPNVSDSKQFNSLNNTYYNTLKHKVKIKKEKMYTSPINISYYNNKNRNRIQINQDIIGYNNLIINNNNYETIDTNQNQKKKKNNFNFYNSKNPKRIGIKNYIKISRINKKFSNNKIIINTSPNNANNNNNNSNNYNSSFYKNEEINYMNMRLNFKLLEKKIAKLNNMVLGENISSPPKNFNQTLDNVHNYKNKYNCNISNSINDIRFLSINKNEKPYNKGLKKFLSMSNNNNSNKDNLDYKNILNQNKNPNHLKKGLKRIAIKKKYLEKKNNRYIKYDESNYSKSDSEISELAGDIIDILKENFHRNKKASDKEINSFSITNNKNISNDTNNNNLVKSFDISKIKIIKSKNKNFSISNPTEIFYNPENKNENKNKNDKSDKKLELSIEHVFTYNHMDNIDNNKRQIDINKSDDDIKENKQLLKFLLNDKDFIRKKLAQEIELMKLLKKNIKNEEQNNKILNNKNNDNDNDNDNDDNEKDEDGEKVINSLVFQATRSNEEENNDNKYINSNQRESNNNNINYNLPLKRNLSNYFIFEKEIKDNKKKKVTFDDKLIFINYNGKEKVPNLHISDSDNKNIEFKTRDISKYLYILASKTITNNIKSIILNANKIDYNSIINKEKINKSNNIIKRNIDFIKLVQKRNFSKEKYKKKVDLKNERISRKNKAQTTASASASEGNNTNNSKTKKEKKRNSNSYKNKKKE